MQGKNQLYYGDNFEILRRMPGNSVDLVYLDPPFKSDRDYNVLFEEKNGTKSKAQIRAFSDTWKWDINSERNYQELVTSCSEKIAQTLQGMRSFLGSSDMMAYLIMMTPRLIELRRILKPTGSIYLHCDPTASHYLKILMDAIFGPGNFQNEIIWCYRSRENSRKRWNRKHDVLLYYGKSKNPYFSCEKVQLPLSSGTVEKYRLIDKNGRKYRLCGRGIQGSPIKSQKDVSPEWERTHPELTVRVYLDEREGLTMPDYWYIEIINQNSKERLGYPTQKPEALLERIIEASCPENGIVLDPFCGCGTAISVAQKLNRRWIGIDITYLAINLIRYRLQKDFGPRVKYQVIGEPVCLEEAQKLAQEDRYQFQWWVLGLVGARPEEAKKGADQGIDGVLYFYDEKRPEAKKIIIQVKSGHVNSAQIRDLRGVLERENAQIGVFITLQKPTKSMLTEAAIAGFYQSAFEWAGKSQFPKMQIITVEELIDGKNIEYPKGTNITLRR